MTYNPFNWRHCLYYWNLQTHEFYLRQRLFMHAIRTGIEDTPVDHWAFLQKKSFKVLCEKNYTIFELNISVDIHFIENLRVPA